jgi:hypothetical protein
MTAQINGYTKRRGERFIVLLINRSAFDRVPGISCMKVIAGLRSDIDFSSKLAFKTRPPNFADNQTAFHHY